MKLLKRIQSSIAGRFKQLTFRPYLIQRQFAGEDLQFRIGDLFGKGAYGSHHNHWPELEWIKAHSIQPGDTVVDCGANHGFTSILFARWAGPLGKVYAFEPSSHNMAILKENLRINAITNVVCHRAAVGAHSGSVAISAHANAAVVIDASAASKTEQVPLIALDDILNNEKVGFLKIDVEGFELEVLRGARRIMAMAPKLDVELHVAFYKNKESELHEIFELISFKRYSVYVQTKVDGVIIPFHKENHSVENLSKCEVVHLFCL